MPGDPTTTILFYVNAALVFCCITELVVLIFIAKKTAYMAETCQTAAIVHIFGLIAFVVQLVMYSCGNKYAIFAVYAALGIMIAAVLTTGVYCLLLNTRSNRALCITAGVLAIAQPLGTIALLVLFAKIRPDNRAEAFVFTGYTYTYAVLESFAEKFELDYIDGATQENLESYDKKELNARLKTLKESATDPEGQFRYGEALINYCPKRSSLAVKYISMAAREEYPPALFNIGYIYEMGLLGVKANVKKAYEFYNRAAKLGDDDAAIRLGIAEIKRGNAEAGFNAFKSRANDKCALYNVAVCLERGVGTDKNLLDAIKYYKLCGSLFTAQKRLFALAAPCVTQADGDKKPTADEDKKSKSGKRSKTVAPPDADEVFDCAVDDDYGGDFKLMMDGLAEVKQGAAKEAADTFLNAVKRRGKWEGVARCMVGALYLDCGALPIDKANGAAYVKSAMDLTPIAKDVYSTIPKSVISPTKKKKESA